MDSKQESDSNVGDRIESLVDMISGDASIENLGDLVDEGLMGRTMTTRNLMDEPQETKQRLRPRRVSRRRKRGGDEETSTPPRRRGRRLRRRPSSRRRATSEPGRAPGGLLSGPIAKSGSETPQALPGASIGEPVSRSRGRVRQRPRRRSLSREGESPIARYGTIPLRVGENTDDEIENQIDVLLGEQDDYDVNAELGVEGEDYPSVYCRVTDDGYLVAAAYEEEYTGYDNYWADYYDSDTDSDTMDTILVKIPKDIADKVVEQGTSGQEYSDGYAAWQVVIQNMYTPEKD